VSRRFYATVLEPLAIPLHDAGPFSVWGAEWDVFVFEDADFTRNLHIAFTAPSRDLVDEFWRVGTSAGYPSDGEPGERPQYSASYYGAFLLDPDGNSVEAVHHDDVAAGQTIDHMWLRVADADASTRFYEAIAGFGEYEVKRVAPDRTRFAWNPGSFSVVTGDERTHNVHIAFPATDNAVVDDFHRVALEAGYRDNGAPGERWYHPGYYGAFVLDPDGNNVEVVNHNRG
jgi:predicted lactoylglutathione lyase